MIQNLLDLGFSEKEAKVYLYIVTYGVSAASEIASHLSLPKSTANFIADTLWRWGYLERSQRSNTYYYEANLDLLETKVQEDILHKSRFLSGSLYKLREINKHIVSKPKITFIDGVESCKVAYRELLKVKVFYEFGAHEDLVHTFGQDFMDEFIRERVRFGVFCDSIGTVGPLESLLQERDKAEMRHLLLFPKEYGHIWSSIAIYDDTVLILNLWESTSWVRIENKNFSETMKTIFTLCNLNSMT